MKLIGKLMILGIMVLGLVWGWAQSKYDDVVEVNEQLVTNQDVIHAQKRRHVFC